MVVCVPSSVLHAIYVVPYRQDRLGNESNISCNTVVYCFYDLHELRVESYLVLLENPRSEGFNEGNYQRMLLLSQISDMKQTNLVLLI